MNVTIELQGFEIADRLGDKGGALKAMATAMDEENQYTVSHIQAKYLSFSKSGPSNPTGLRFQTGSARRALRATSTRLESDGLVSSIGGYVTSKGVNYLAVHEFGATIPPHTIRARNGGALKFVINGKVILRKSVKHPGATLPARGMIQRGIRDRLPDYRQAMGAAYRLYISGGARE